MDPSQLSDKQYELLFDVRRSLRYHDRRRAFYELLHQITSLMTILMAGSVLFDIAKSGETASWMVFLSTVAALLAAADMVVGYSRRANLHTDLRSRFADLEISILFGDLTDSTWRNHRKTRLSIEKDEPPVYVVLDSLCRNELLVAEGFDRKTNVDQFAKVSWWQTVTSQLWRWENHQPT